jgi:hypothetical protein
VLWRSLETAVAYTWMSWQPERSARTLRPEGNLCMVEGNPRRSAKLSALRGCGATYGVHDRRNCSASDVIGS